MNWKNFSRTACPIVLTILVVLLLSPIVYSQEVASEFRYPMGENFGDMKNIDVFLAKERDIAVDWMRSKGRKFKDYRAFFRNWIRRKLVELNNPKEEIKSNNPQLNNPYK